MAAHASVRLVCARKGAWAGAPLAGRATHRRALQPRALRLQCVGHGHRPRRAPAPPGLLRGPARRRRGGSRATRLLPPGRARPLRSTGSGCQRDCTVGCHCRRSLDTGVAPGGRLRRRRRVITRPPPRGRCRRGPLGRRRRAGGLSLRDARSGKSRAHRCVHVPHRSVHIGPGVPLPPQHPRVGVREGHEEAAPRPRQGSVGGAIAQAKSCGHGAGAGQCVWVGGGGRHAYHRGACAVFRGRLPRLQA